MRLAGPLTCFYAYLSYIHHMNEQVLVYEIKSSARENAEKLFSADQGYFYWNDTLFSNLELGDYVFIVNTHDHYVLFSKLDKAGIPARIHGNKTTFSDSNRQIEVAGKWNKFVRLKIISKHDTPPNWKWKSLASSERTYLHGKRVADKNSEKRLLNIRQLKELSADALYNTVLDNCTKSFQAPGRKVWFVAQGSTFQEDIKLRRLSAPRLGRDKKSRIYWENVQKVKTGDVIFNYSDGEIKAVSVATGNGGESKSHDMPEIDGYKVNIDVTLLDPPIPLSAFIEKKKEFNDYLAGIQNKPFTSDGKVNQGYLYEFSAQAGKLIRNIYGKPFGKKSVDDFFDAINAETDKLKQISPHDIIEHAHKYITSKGFRYQPDEIANFYLALCAKPFVILAGISGTGKTQLPRKFAEALGFPKEHVIQLAVRPDWTDGSDLLGYTSLDGKFIPKDLAIAIQKATANPGKPYFFILDEMNLARVEHYFSDFLSVIETRSDSSGKIITDPILREEMLSTAKNKSEFSSMGWPENLFLIGTVNMDETTHAFSRKVLDRANSIEMNEIDLDWIEPDGSTVKELQGISNDLFKSSYLSANDLSAKEKLAIEREMGLLKRVNKILQKADLHFAYRVRDEIAFYLTLNKNYKLMSDDAAFDFQLVQKILPRIHGSSERIQAVLVDLFNLLEDQAFRSSDFESMRLEEKINSGSLKYKRASSKIIFMLKRFNDDRFTSFWL